MLCRKVEQLAQRSIFSKANLVFAIAVISLSYPLLTSTALGVEPVWSYKTGDSVVSVAISQDGSYIVAGSDDNVYFFNREGKLLWRYETDDTVCSVAISSNGSYVAAASDYTIYFFDRLGHLLWRYKTGGDINSVAMSSDGRYIVVGGDDEKVYFFDSSGNLLWRYTTDIDVFSSEAIESVAISSDGSYVAVGIYGGVCLLFNKVGDILWSYDTDVYIVDSVAISGNGSYVAVGSPFGVHFFNNNGELLWSYTPKSVSGDFWFVSISSGGDYIVALDDYSDRIYFFDKEGRLLWESDPLFAISVAISSDARYIATGTRDGGIYFLDKAGSILWSSSVDWNINSIAVNSDGRYVVAGNPFRVYFFDTFKIIQDKIQQVRKTIQKVKSLGVDTSKAEYFLELANQELNIGDFEKAKKLVYRAENFTKQIYESSLPAINKIKKAQKAIQKAKSSGLDTSKAEALLEQANQELNRGDFGEVLTLAEQAYSIAIDIDQDGVPNEEDFAPKIPNNYVYAGSGIGVIVFVGSLYSINKIRMKRKMKRERYERTKAKLLREMDEFLKKG